MERPPHLPLPLSRPARIAFPEPTYSTGTHVNREFDTTVFRYSYQSLVSPASVYEYDVATSQSTLLKMQEVPGGFDPALAGRDKRRPAAEWARLGVESIDGRAAQPGDAPAAVVLPGGAQGEAFLVFSTNFRALRAYNPSDYYALCICLLGDRMAAA